MVPSLQQAAFGPEVRLRIGGCAEAGGQVATKRRRVNEA